MRGLTHPAAILHRVRAGLPALRELLAQEPGPDTSLNRVIGQDRTLALVRSSLGSVNEVAHLNGATVNDVLLAVIAGGLRGLLGSRGEPIEGVTLPIYVPISLRRGGSAPDGGNLISQMVVPLPVGIADPGRRLRQIAAETAKRKAVGRPTLGTMFHSRLVRGAMLKLIVRQRVNVVSADLPGPPTPRYFAGAPLIEVFPLVNLLGTESLGVGALSYAGHSTCWRLPMRRPIPTSTSSPTVCATTSAHWLSPPPTFAVETIAAVCRSRDGARGCGRPAP